jgi:hypothetical protein
MQQLALLCAAALVLSNAWAGTALGEEPPSALLNAIFPVLRGKKPPTKPLEVNFLRRTEHPNGLACGLETVDLVESRDTELRRFRFLGEVTSDPGQPFAMFIGLSRMTVDADGSQRAYHPDDPFGIGICTTQGDHGPLKGVCALDNLSNAEIQVYAGSERVPQFREAEPGGTSEPNPTFATAWKSLWAEIAARKNNWVDLEAIFGKQAPDETKLYYLKETDSAATFDTSIIPFKDQYPCQYGGDIKGYFVSATKPHLSPPARLTEDACGTASYLDSTQIPFFVLPGGIFKQFAIGDVAIGVAASEGTTRLALGIVGDVGPKDQIGEGSIQFVKQLQGITGEPKNSIDAGKLDIKVEKKPGGIDQLGVLVLAGTADALGLDYSKSNITRVAQSALSRWLGGNSGRLQACLDTSTPNPLQGFGTSN